jgi:hypothetical protein
MYKGNLQKNFLDTKQCKILKDIFKKIWISKSRFRLLIRSGCVVVVVVIMWGGGCGCVYVWGVLCPKKQ